MKIRVAVICRNCFCSFSVPVRFGVAGEAVLVYDWKSYDGFPDVRRDAILLNCPECGGEVRLPSGVDELCPFVF